MAVSLEVRAPARPVTHTITALSTGVFALVAFGLFAAAEASGAADGSPLATASSVAVLLALLALCAHGSTMMQSHAIAGTTAVVTTAIGAGGAWASVFVLPSLVASGEMSRLAEFLAPVQAGYLLSFTLLAAGWIAAAVVRLRSSEVPRWAGVLLLVGALLVIAPAADPLRILVLATAVALTGAVPPRTSATDPSALEGLRPLA